MNHSEGFLTSNDGLKLYYQIWKPDTPPKAIIQLIHGLAEHTSRYTNVVETVIPVGLAVYGQDLRGHGKSEGIAGYINSFDELIEDELNFTRFIQNQEPNTPIFLMGHSLGSIISIFYVAENHKYFRGLILSGTGFPATSKVNPIVLMMARILSRIFPKGKIKLDLADEISRDPKVVEAYVNDPMVFKKVTYRFGAELIKVSKILTDAISAIPIPILGQCGGADALMLNPSELFSSVTSSDKDLKIYENLYHEVYNELESDRKSVLKDLTEWLNAHI